MTTPAIERRAYDLVELRADIDKRTIRGHAAVFNSLSEDLGGFRERIAPGAFGQSLKEDDIRALWNHDSNYVLGRNRSGTLTLEEDANGLMMRIDAPDAQWADDMITSMARGDVTGASFGFRTLDDSWDQEAALVVRTLKRVQLFDVSPVTFPAYLGADASVARRSLDAWRAGQVPSINAEAVGRVRRQRLLEMGL